MRIFLKNNWFVFTIYFLLLCLSFFYISAADKITLHKQINGFVGNQFIDSFFYYITYLGDGLFAIFLLLVLVIVNTRLGIYSITTFLTASLFSQFLKRYMFDDVNRPWYVFQGVKDYSLRLVEGVDTHIHNSFPSGHATQAFAILMCLVFVCENKLLKIFFFLLALFSAYSRVYLSQHWLNDVVAGSVIGFIFSGLFYFIFIYKDKLNRLNTSIFFIWKKG